MAKHLATATVDFAGYVATDQRDNEVTAELVAVGNKITRGALHLTVRCEPTNDDAAYAHASARS